MDGGVFCTHSPRNRVLGGKGKKGAWPLFPNHPGPFSDRVKRYAVDSIGRSGIKCIRGRTSESRFLPYTSEGSESGREGHGRDMLALVRKD